MLGTRPYGHSLPRAGQMADVNKMSSIASSAGTGPVPDDPINKVSSVAESAGTGQAGRFVIQDRIYDSVRKGPMAGNELYELAYKGIKQPEWGTFHVHISKLNKRLKDRGL